MWIASKRECVLFLFVLLSLSSRKIDYYHINGIGEEIDCQKQGNA